MSDIIQLLPDTVANQIAAGEVIQRPASVIKELVENAIDAEAGMINIIVVDAGRTCIQVIDDGKGMSETDARLSFERHATSKIREASDLFNLHTMGFRGEALASIAAVAQVELRTRSIGNEIGTVLSLTGSKVNSQEACSCPVGSNFKVENIFFNVPARRKFLKSNATELNNILTAFERIALVYPHIGFTFHSNGTELFHLNSCGIRQRITDVFGKRLDQDLLPVNVETTICKISGFVGKPESARKKCSNQYLFSNGRYLKHPYFHKAVITAFDRMIPMGEQIPYFIYIDVDPDSIDVNIHPTKTEIKFENEQAIWQILMATVKESIGRFCNVPSIDFDTQGSPDIPLFNPENKAEMPRPLYNNTYNPFKTGQERSIHDNWEQLYNPSRTNSRLEETYTFDMPEEEQAQTSVNEIIAEKSPAHYQYKGHYIMTAVKSGLMIIDQHRAHVRILYDKYIEQFENKTGTVQRLLFPEMVTLPQSQSVIFQKILPDMETVGFDLTDLGGGSYAINGVPSGIGELDWINMITDMVEDYIEKGEKVNKDLHQSLSLTMARNSAITVGQVLSNDEMENIVNNLFASSNVNYTPEGKSILCILPQQEIEHLLA